MSFAVTVTDPAVPAVVELGNPETVRLTALAALTVIPVCEPVMLLVTVSVAVIDCVPEVFKVKLKVPAPLVKPEFAGKVAWMSVEVKCTVPE